MIGWNRDSTPDEIVTEKDNVIVFDGSNGKPVMTILKHISEKCEGDESTYKDGDEIVSSYRPLLVADNASGFDSWVVSNTLVKEITELKSEKTARVPISLPLRCSVKLINTVEVPQ